MPVTGLWRLCLNYRCAENGERGGVGVGGWVCLSGTGVNPVAVTRLCGMCLNCRGTEHGGSGGEGGGG